MKLYSYFRSSAAYRVRIALNLKGVSAQILPVHLVKGEQKDPAYTAINPQGLVPSLIDEGCTINQSLAIMEYLDEKYPQVPLLPKDIDDKAMVRALALTVACEIHPLNNLRVLQYLSTTLAVSDEQKQAWYAHWIHEGFVAFERQLSQCAGLFCFKDTPTIADCCLVPQVYNAKRFGVDLSAYPIINRVVAHCMSLEAFVLASPEQQADAM